MAKKVTINGSNLLSSTQDAWGGQNTTQYSQTIHGTTVPPGAEWGMNRGEVERFIKSSINAQQSRVGYYVCDNSAGTSAKAVVASGYQLAIGGCVRIKMTNANTANNVTLNINSTGAKALFYNGARASSSNSWEAGEVLEVYYDGTQYQCESGGSTASQVKYDNFNGIIRQSNIQEVIDNNLIIDGETLKEKLYGRSVYGLSDAEIVYSDIRGEETTNLSQAYRIHVIIPCQSGWILTARYAAAGGILCFVASSRYGAIRASDQYLIQRLSNPYEYSTSLIEATTNVSGYLNISYKNSSNTVISETERTNFINGVMFQVVAPSPPTGGDIQSLFSLLGYYVCDTAEQMAEKVVSATDYALTNGGCIRIKMTNANTANNVTLNINSTGAKALYYDGERASSTNSWEAGEVLEVYYDGTQYQCVSGGGGVGAYDVSKGGMEYNGLSSALSAIPVSDRKSGMTINYIDSNTHKYEQCRYILQYENTTAGNTDFTNTDNWVNTDEDIKKLAQILTNDVVLTLADADIAPTHNGVEVPSVTSAERLHLIYEIPSGAIIKLRCTLNSGIAVSLYSTRAEALNAGNNYIETYTGGGYVKSPINATSSQGGFLNISYKNASGGVMTQQDYDAFMANIFVEIKIIGETDRLTEIEEDILSLQQETADIPEIRENVELINSVLYGEGESTPETRTLADADIVPTRNAVEVSSVTSADRLHLIYEIPSGAIIKLRCTLNSGIAVSLYSTRADAVQANRQYIETYTNYVYTTAQINVTSSQGGFLNINYKNASGGVMTQQDYDAFMANVSVEITWTTTVQSGLVEQVNEIEASMLSSSSGNNNLFVGEVEQGQRGTKRISSSSLSVAMSNTVGVPYERCAFKAFLPAGLKATILIGATSETLSIGGNMTNGQTYQFPANVMYYSMNFSKENGGGISYEDVRDNIDKGSICFVITNSEAPTISRVSYNENFARMQMRGTSLSGQVNLLTIAHISDIHSDYVRARNFFEIAEFLNVAYTIHTGDVVGWPYNGFSFFKDAANVYSGKKINVIGNHDVFDISEASAFESAIEPFTSELGIETTTNYYYYDDATWNVRFIVMNVFENALANGHNQPDVTGTQMNWLINTLSSTPANYGVILCYHIPANNIVSNNYGFYQNTVSVFHTMDGYGIGVKGSPIQKIINAFINKEQISDTYTSHGTAYSYTADFTSVPETAEFICHMTGHEHSDRVGYYTGYDGTIEGQAKQLVFNICSGVSLYGTSYPYLAHLSDCPRGGKGATQDAFNVMSINRSNKTIAITRMGSFMTNLGEQRLVATIPYK